MKKIKNALSLILALAMLLACAACGGTQESAQPSAEPTPEAVSPSPEAESSSIVLTDQAGREVTLDAPAETVVSCYYISTYAMIALGAQERVVGLEKKADTRPIYSMAAPELLEKPAVGTMKELDVEAVAALSPELVIMPAALIDYADTLTELGIPVMVVNPEGHDELVEMLTLMGTALGLEENAEALVSYYDAQLAALAELGTGEEKPSVLMLSNSSYLSAAPAAMYQSSLIEAAGGVNAAAELEGDYWTELSYEDILAMAPEVIVIPAGADYTADDVKGDAQLANLPAVQNGAVYQMPSGIEEWDSPIPSGILGCMWLASVLHPDEYSFEDFTADAQEFYSTFYGFELDAALITK